MSDPKNHVGGRSARTIPHIRHFWMFTVVALLLCGCGSSRHEVPPHLLTTIPEQAEWIDCGVVIEAGTEDAWDRYLWGGFTNSVVKRDDTYYLYYQGARGYDDAAGTVTWRAIGVATSQDGIHFTKYAHNPVLTWSPGENFEEGAVSGGAFVDANGEIALYYGANSWVEGDQVNADARLAVSTDGFHFTDLGVVLNHEDRGIWGAGDEIFPIIGFEEAGRWFSYYIPNGSPQSGQLGVAWGSQRDALTTSSAARAGRSAIAVWGSGSAVQLAPESYVLFLNNVRGASGPVIEVRSMSTHAPGSLSKPVRSYQFADFNQATVLLDGQTETWFMYYRNADADQYGVKMAAADGRTLTCTVP